MSSSSHNIVSFALRGRWVIAACAAAAFYAGCKDDPTAPSQTAVMSALVPASPQVVTGTVGQPVAQRPAVIVRDQRGDPMFGVEVTFAVTAGGGSLAGATVFTDAQGVARVESWTLGTATGTNTVTATAGSLTPVTFNATAQAGTPVSLAKTAGDEQTATVGTAVAVAPAVTVRDQFNNPVPNVTVTFAVASGGGSVTVPAAVSNNAGVATVGSWTLGTVPGSNTLDATLDTLGVTFAATGVVGAAATMTKHAGDEQTALAATAVATPPAVRVTDAHGNPVAGVSVTFSVTGGGGSVTGGTQATDANGVAAVGSWTLGTAAGQNTLTAAAGSLSATFTATSVAGDPANITAHAGDQQTSTVGTAVAVSPAVRVTDAHGNPLAAVQVTFAVSGGGGSVTGATQTTGLDGVATVGSWTLGTGAGANTLSATAGALNVTFSATGTPAGPASMAVHAGDNQTSTVATPVAIAPAVRITDVHGNPVPGVLVAFSVTLGGGSITSAQQTTNGNGVATVGSWTLGETAGANSLMASAAAGLLTATFSATGTADAPSTIEKVAGDTQVATAGSVVATAPAVRVRDQFGNAVSGVTVTFAVSAGGGSVTGATPVTASDGTATVGSWTLGTVAGANELTAGVGALAVTFTATGAPGAPANIVALTGDGQVATVNTEVADELSVRVTDAHDNPIPDLTVTFAVESGGGSLTGAAPATDADGVATLGSWTLGTFAGANTVRATAGGVSIVFSATGTAGAPAVMTKHAGDEQNATVNTAVVPAPAVLITDAFGNPVEGVAVTFAVASGGGSVTGATPVTNSAGIATVGSWTLGTAAGANTLSATSGALAPVTFSATGTAGPVAGMLKVAGDNQSAPAGSTLPVSPAVLLIDQFFNPVPGITVTFAVTAGGGSVAGAQPATGSDGVATVGSWTLGADPGMNSLAASIPNFVVTFSATGN